MMTARKMGHKSRDISNLQKISVTLTLITMHVLPYYASFGVLLHVEHMLGFGPFDTFIWTGPAVVYYFIRIRKMNRG